MGADMHKAKKEFGAQYQDQLTKATFGLPPADKANIAKGQSILGSFFDLVMSDCEQHIKELDELDKLSMGMNKYGTT